MLRQTLLGVVALMAAFFVGAVAAHAQSTTLRVVNETDSYLTVSIDGNYGCNTAGHTTCTIPIAVGTHRLRAVRTDDGAAVERSEDIGEGGATWTINSGEAAGQGGADVGSGADGGEDMGSPTSLQLDNQTSSYVTVSVDGNYGCNTAPHTTCTIPITVGTHNLKAVRTDNRFALDKNGVFISSKGAVWTLADE